MGRVNGDPEIFRDFHASWGVRDLDQDILPIAEVAGLDLIDVIEMPANNLSVIFERR